MNRRILLVDDDPRVLAGLRRTLSSEPYDLICCESAGDALEFLSRNPVSLIISDERMPGMSGSELLSIVCRDFPDTARIILTGEASLEAAMRAINEGQIYRFLTKPCNDLELMQTVKQALEHQELLVQARRLLVVERSHSGAIVIDDAPADRRDLNQLISEIMEQIDEPD